VEQVGTMTDFIVQEKVTNFSSTPVCVNSKLVI